MSSASFLQGGRVGGRAVAAAGFVLLATLLLAALLWRPAAILTPWLVAWLLVLGFSVGSMVLILVHALVGGVWLRSSMYLFRPLSVLMPLVALMGVPLLFGLGFVYEWAGSPEAATHPDVARIYLNPWSFTVRYVAILGMWSLMGLYAGLRGASLSPLPAGLMLLVYGITVTLGATDWLMSLAPKWASTAFPAYLALLQISSAIGAAAGAARSGVERDATRDLGKLLVAMALGLTYLQFIQYLVMWSGNLPENAKWYIPRADGFWQLLNLLSFLFGAVVPFVAMLSEAGRRSQSRVSLAGLSMLLGIALQYVWLAATSFEADAVWLLPLAYLAAAALFGGLLAPVGRWLGSREVRHG